MTTQDSAHTSTSKARTAPSPEDSRKPDSPNDLAKPTWMYIAKRTLREFTKDQCPDAAAGLTYYAVLSLFPALLALVSLIGIFGDAAGTLTIDPARPAQARLEMTIPVAKVTTASEGLTKHLLSKDFFNTAVNSEAKFVSTAVTVSGTTAKVAGNLTLNGVTKPVTLDTQFVGAGANPMSKAATIGFHAKATIRRSDFGIAYGIPVVSDAVELDITAAFEKAA